MMWHEAVGLSTATKLRETFILTPFHPIRLKFIQPGHINGEHHISSDVEKIWFDVVSALYAGLVYFNSHKLFWQHIICT